MSVFISMSDDRIAAHIDTAVSRVALATPAFRTRTAGALQRAVTRLGRENVTVVVDCNDEVFRLGFGDLDAVTQARSAGCDVRQAAGLRVGVLITDDQGWAFAPTALYVAAEVHSDETPNAVALMADAVPGLAEAIFGPRRPNATKDAEHSTSRLDVEIGVAPLTNTEVENVARSLAEAPPLPFDIARQVRVFEPYIQYVEISLRGCAIQRHRLEVPRSIQGLDRREEIGRRLRTTFELIERDSDVSSKKLEDDLRQIRDDFTKALGQPWGRVLLRSRRSLFDEKIVAFRARLDVHRKAVEAALDSHLQSSREQLIDYFLPIAIQTPPDSLLGQIIGDPNEQQVRAWLAGELSRVFPTPAELVSGMTLDVQYRDVTYDTLTDEQFATRLRSAFPHVDWDKPFNEFEAAREREQDVPTPAGDA